MGTTGAGESKASGLVIGAVTTYIGDEIPGYKGKLVRICAVLHGGARPDVDIDCDDYYVTDNALLAQLGGVTKDDRLDTVHFNASGGVSFVHCDPRAIDVELFAHLDVPVN